MMGSWHYMKMTRIPFLAIYSQCGRPLTRMKTCERDIPFQLKVYQRLTFPGIQMCKGWDLGAVSPYTTL